jgi:hypothetical protein
VSFSGHWSPQFDCSNVQTRQAKQLRTFNKHGLWRKPIQSACDVLCKNGNKIRVCCSETLRTAVT